MLIVCVLNSPASTQPSDEAIADQLLLKLAGDAVTKSAAITVECKNGVVTLSGTAERIEQRIEAFSLAKKVNGVKQVVSNVIVHDAKVPAVETPSKPTSDAASPHRAATKQKPQKPKPEPLSCKSAACIIEIRAGGGVIAGIIENRSDITIEKYARIDFTITDRSGLKVVGSANAMSSAPIMPGQRWLFEAQIPDVDFATFRINYLFTSDVTLDYSLGDQREREHISFRRFKTGYYRGPLLTPE